jgi:hypothetical protein
MSRQEILERERRWRTPAAAAALVSLLLLVLPPLLQRSAFEGDSLAEQVSSIDANSGDFLLGAIGQGVGYLLLLVPLLYVFQAARARSEAVRGAMIGFVIIGPILFGAQVVLQAVALKDFASDFAAAGGLELRADLEKSLAELEKAEGEVEEVTFYPDGNAYEVERAQEEFEAVEFPADEEAKVREKLEAADFDFTIEEDGDPGDAEIQNGLEDSSLYSVSSQLLFPALLALIVGLFYTSLQAMRTGLFTRFFGTLGMALAVSILLLGPTGLIVLLAGMGLVIIGRTPSGRPPAWDAGEAIPWPKPGEEEARGAAEVLEGDASEVEDADGDEGDEESPHADRRQRAKRKKRKRR